MHIIDTHISHEELKHLANERYGDLVKAVVDVERGVMAIGMEMHVDGEATLLEQGSKQQNLWGINIYPEKPRDEWVEFDSMINLRPRQNNRSRGVDDPEIQRKIIAIVDKLTA
ncbi:MAG: hypothetical protein HY437_00045 [Candidatus Magasanikbacteria bacterium]|nr:hypothetical protein [Candidatus Magasanikbacteria bacterium]